ncbi:MAG TPA: carboxypeptidase M32 [Beijerinckiaceae bacterium]|jgi:carboxypeptidase Taq|nr:carboxypeptidase M32 [Beijerinckiaceae bacterium]
MSLSRLNAAIGKINDVLCAASVLVWDSRTMLPKGAAVARASQLATLTLLARDLLLTDETRQALDGARREVEAFPPDDPWRRAVRNVEEAIALHLRIPAELIERKAKARALGAQIWIEARANDDFASFAPALGEIVAVTRDYVDAVGWSAHPYDVLIGLYEPGGTLAEVGALLNELRRGLKPILDAALGRARPARDFLDEPFPEEKVKAAARLLTEVLGYDYEHGRLDKTVHPFAISFTREDVRITMRLGERSFANSLFGAMHETGHALYEQNVGPAFSRTALTTDLIGLHAGGGASLGTHESQSRLQENHVGRSRDFWRAHFGRMKEVLGGLAGVEADAFHRAINVVEPGLIRTEADELTYDFHVMLRVELEAALLKGDIKVADIPGAWREAMRRHLGVTVPNDREGCLQDVHWASGAMGSFCTYTLGNVMAAQLFETAKRDGEGVASGLAKGDTAPLRLWLKENIWRHGKRFSRDELLTRATGRALEAGPYLRYLEGKYGKAA